MNHNGRTALAALHKGEVADAERLAASAVLIDPNDPEANLTLGLIAGKKGQTEASLKLLRKALDSAPSLVDASNALSRLSFQLRNLKHAESYARHSLRSDPQNAGAWNNLGLALHNQGRLQEAVNAFETAIKFGPSDGGYYSNLGNCLLSAGMLADAEKLFQLAFARGLRTLALCLQLSEFSLKRNAIKEAVMFAMAAVENHPISPDAENQLAWALSCDGDLNEGEEHFKRALTLHPNHGMIMSTYASALQRAGRFEEAKAIFLQSLRSEPGNSRAYLGLFGNERVAEEMRPIISQAEKLAARSTTLPRDAVALHFSIGKAYDDLGEYRKAMDRFDQAHEVSRHLLRADPFNPDAHRRAIDSVIRTCSPELLQKAAETGNPTQQPIFILGMMRSGTTLVEQIISCHPDVAGAGEVGFFQEGPLRNNALQSFSIDALNQIAQAYLEDLNRRADGKRITDKMPANYLSAGFIHLAFPKAQILVVQRDPCDTALSIWITANRAPINWAHKKSDIAFVYREYQRLLQHWKSVIPPASMMEVRYEKLIDEYEETVRGVLDFCNLEWNEACLHHDQNPRLIHTPSFWQARQPIFRSSLNRTENYRDCLGAFAQLLKS